jgi:hypothetical protein
MTSSIGKSRCVYLTQDMHAANAAVQAARRAGIANDDLSLVARGDIELENIPEHMTEDHHDFSPGAVRGVAMGGGTGLLLGLIGVVVPPLGITLAGAAAIAVAGAAMGAWTGALVGLDVPDAVSRTFEAEIKAGHILLVVDASEVDHDAARTAIVATGAAVLPFHQSTTMS